MINLHHSLIEGKKKENSLKEEDDDDDINNWCLKKEYIRIKMSRKRIITGCL